MAAEHIVVDGSNIATEGRNAPSLAQLEEAVKELRREFPEAEVTVIVDATFAHRIDPSELERFETAALAGEYVHPPAGAIGRGDAFLLRIAEKIDATVLSNDSFQEFHGEHPWLFERGRLLGATPVPGVGWIFVPRAPVRGPKSRRAVKDSDKAKRKISKAIEAATKEAVAPPRAGSTKEAAKRAAKRGARSGGEAQGDGAVVAAEKAKSGRSRSRGDGHPAAVNDPLTFISFIANHPLGKEVSGRVDSYTSHGAVVFVGAVQCYVPLTNLGEPAPRSARAVLKRNEERTFVVTALDPQRRGVELALPEFAQVSGRPSEETIAAEMRLAKKKAAPAKKAAAPAKNAATPAKNAATPAKKAAATPVKKAALAKKAAAPAKKAATPAKKAAPTKKAAPSASKEAALANAAATATKVTPKKAAPTKKAAAKKTTPPAMKAPAKKSGRAEQAAASGKASAKRAASGTSAARDEKAAPRKSSVARKTPRSAPAAGQQSPRTRKQQPAGEAGKRART